MSSSQDIAFGSLVLEFFLSHHLQPDEVSPFLQNEWSQPQVQGDLVTARAGHAGIAVDDDWFIVGGGDNRNGM